MDWAVYSPSYKRADKCCSHTHFHKDSFFYCVHEFEAKQYEERFPGQVIVIPDALRGNIARCRNFILENKKTKYVVMVDDDIKKFVYIYERDRIPMGKNEMRDMISKGFLMAEDLECGLWGMNCQNDPRFYAQNQPFSFSLIVLGTFSCILDTSLRYDESITLKEDYDFFIQNLIKYRKVFRMNMYNYTADHLEMEGGCQLYRTEELEAKHFETLQKKYGSKIVQRNFKNKESFNPIIKRPF